MEKFLKSKRGVLTIFLIIFLIALFIRGWHLEDRGEGMDELHWMQRGSYLVNKIAEGDFGHATDIFERHPGIPAAFLMGLTMNFLATPNHYEIPNYIKPFDSSLEIIDPLIAARIPIVLLGALTCAFLYFFVLKMWSPAVGITAGLLLALDPFHIALSRIAHQDVALTFFFMGALFCYYIGEIKNKTNYKMWAGIFFGLAFLTKIVALLIPIIIFIWKTIIYFNKKDKFKLYFDVFDLIILLIGVSMFFVFYTEMWGNPVMRFIDHLSENFGSEASKDTHFFMGYVGQKAIRTFYLVIIPFKMSLLVFIGFIASLIFGIKYLWKNKKVSKRVLLLILIILIVVGIMSLVGKMKDRYVMPAWPSLIIIASLGIMYILKYIFKYIPKPSNEVLILSASILIILAFNLPPVISYSPYYFIYYNPIARLLVGGPNNLRNYVEMGWGEGMKEAAEYLNEKENVKELGAISSCQSCFEPYFKGKFLRWKREAWFKKRMEDGDIDYAVLLIRVVQRHSPKTMYKIYKSTKPEKVININGIDMVWIHNIKKNPP